MQYDVIKTKIFCIVTRVIEIIVVSTAEKILMTVTNIKQIETERDVIIRWRHYRADESRRHPLV